MASLQTKSFPDLVQAQVAAIQGGTQKYLVDLSIGSILRAVVEAYAAVAMWLQGIVLQLLATTRAATSNGADLDSWVADYGLRRLAATPATGEVYFSRFTPTSQAVVPVGAIVQSADGTLQFGVTVDTGNAAYSAAVGGYVIPAGVVGVNAPVAALSAGAAGNVGIGAVALLGQAISGVDTAANPATFVNGDDAESDAALRARFVGYIASLSKATKGAVGYATTSVQQGLSYILVENQNYAGAAQPGYFYVVVDDGTGYPSSALLAAVSNAVDAVRPLTSSFGVFAPIVVTVAASLAITTAPGYDHGAIGGIVAAAVTNYINGLPLGASLAWSRIVQVAYDASPAVTNVASLLLNGGTADVAITAKQTAVAGTVTVS